MLYYILQYNVILYTTIQCYTIYYNTRLYYTLQYNALIYMTNNTIYMEYDMVKNDAIQNDVRANDWLGWCMYIYTERIRSNTMHTYYMPGWMTILM